MRSRLTTFLSSPGWNRSASRESLQRSTVDPLILPGSGKLEGVPGSEVKKGERIAIQRRPVQLEWICKASIDYGVLGDEPGEEQEKPKLSSVFAGVPPLITYDPQVPVAGC